MNYYQMGTIESSFAEIIWENEPISSTELSRLAEEKLNWKKSTTYTVLRRLCDKGIFENTDGKVRSLISKEEFYSLQSENFVDETFSGSLSRCIFAQKEAYRRGDQRDQKADRRVQGGIMNSIFYSLLSLSMSASVIAAVLIVIRPLTKKLPKYVLCLSWSLVAFRLLCPFTLKSALSLMPRRTAEVSAGSVIYVLHSVASVSPADPASQSAESAQAAGVSTVIGLIPIIWAFGTALMFAYSAFSYFRVRRSVRECVMIEKNVYLCDHLPTAFILGILRPKIYIPSSVHNDEIGYILTHERAHLKRLDHLWKPLGYTLLAVYWFNPLMWAAYFFLCRDIELACDEKVIASLGENAKKPYSALLLDSSVPRRTLAACPLAFGENSVKERIKNVLSYKKPALWVITASILALVALSVCFLTNPLTAKADENASDDAAEPIQTTENPPEIIDEPVDLSVYGDINKSILGSETGIDDELLKIVVNGQWAKQVLLPTSKNGGADTIGYYESLDAYFEAKGERPGMKLVYYKIYEADDEYGYGMDAFVKYSYIPENVDESLARGDCILFIKEYADGSIDALDDRENCNVVVASDPDDENGLIYNFIPFEMDPDFAQQYYKVTICD